MITYRPHRGSLKEAMAEARSFPNEDAMNRWISEDSAKAFGVAMFSPEDIVIGTEEYDDYRTGWKDTRYVCVKRYGSEVFPIPQCIGMCATKFTDVVKMEAWNDSF